MMSVVTRQWSDAAMMPLGEEKDGKLTIQVERQVKEGEKLDSLLVYIVDEADRGKEEIRPITWCFTDQKISKETSDNRCLLIKVYAARPTVPGEGREQEELVVKLENFEVRFFDN